MLNIDKIYPLTDVQTGMLFEASRSDYAHPVYISQMVFSIEDAIEVPLFLKAFSVVLKRHEVLRLSIPFDSERQSFVQRIVNVVEMPHTFFDYTETIENKKLEKFNLFLRSDLEVPFDFEKPPLMRLVFFKLGDKNYRIVWTRHHILMGGSSVKAVVNELFSIYKALLNKEDIILPEPTPYEKSGDDQKRLNMHYAKRFWEKYLKDFPGAVSLPALLKNEKKLKKIESIYSALNKEEYNQLRKFVDKKDLTVNTLLEAAWGIVLSNYTGKQHAVFGSVRAYPDEALKNSVGLFINVLPIHLNMDRSDNVIRFLKRIRRKNKVFRQYTATSLGKIKEWLNLSPDNFLYQSIVDYKPYSLRELIQSFFKDVRCDVYLNLNIPYPLSLEVIKEADFLEIKLHYDANLFQKPYIHSILIYFKQVLNELVTCQVKSTLSEISTLPMYDFKLINAWNTTHFSYPRHKTIHKVFEEQVEKTPFATALVYKHNCLSYEELNKRANQLAHYLIQSGIQVETIIAVCLKPTVNRIVAILAILKSGGAYLPIDPAYPENRINYLVKDSQPKIIVTDSNCIHLLANIDSNEVGFDILSVNIDTFNFSEYLTENPVVPVKAKNLVYVIYTSGSTGNPKGVMIEHQSALNMALSCVSQFNITNNSRILQMASFSFDVSVAEWCMTLLSGASLYLMDKGAFSPETIVEALGHHKINIIFLSTSILAILPKVALPHLKVIAFGGEPCNESVVSFWSKNRLFLNAYGVTEASVCSAMIPYDSNQKNMFIIGKPLFNTQIIILSENQTMLPIGVAGELYIGGDGIARGYLNNVEMTANKFVSKSFHIKDKNFKSRLYRTGDIARWLPSGVLEFLGRADDQVKVKGFRVELREVEHALEKHPFVHKAVVVVNKWMQDKQMYAYFLSKDQKIDLSEVKKFLQLQLPAYMIPVRFLQITQLPLTPNGKIDKEKLLSLPFEESQENFSDEYTALSVHEKTLVLIIQSILNIKHVPIDKNFFDIGFDSIGLVYFSVRLSEQLGFKIEIVTFFSYPTVRALSEYIKTSVQDNFSFGLKNKTISKIKLKKKKVKFADE